MGYVRLKPRSWPANQDDEKREEFKREIQIIRVKADVDLWFCDETGIEGDPIPRKIICRKGESPRINYFGSHIKSSVVGAVRVRDGKFTSLIMPFMDSDLFQYFLNELQEAVDRSRHNIIVMDNASWHKTKKLDWGVLEPMYLPTYSPDFNPIEELWLAIKREFFSWFWTNNHDKLDDRLEIALKYYIARPYLVQSICSMRTFK